MYDRAAGLHLKCPTWGSATFLSHRSLNERKIKNSDETILCSICFRRTRIKLIRNNMNDECTEHNEELWTIYPRQKKNRVTFVLPCVKWNIWIELTVLSTTIDCICTTGGPTSSQSKTLWTTWWSTAKLSGRGTRTLTLTLRSDLTCSWRRLLIKLSLHSKWAINLGCHAPCLTQ